MALAPLVLGIGVAQVVSWGALIYAIAVLGGPIGAELGISPTAVFGAFSLSLVVSGLAGPSVGKLIDRVGGRHVLAWGSVGAAASLVALAWAPNAPFYFAAWTAAGLARAMTLYEAAFATVSQHAGKSFRSAVTAITLLGGFAGTVFLPLSYVGVGHFGWRATLVLYAALEIAICLPLHLRCVPRGPGKRASAGADSSSDTTPPFASRETGGFVALSTAFALAAFITSAIAAHVITLLQSRGLTTAAAVWVSALIGPMQVVGRLAEFSLARRVSPIHVGMATLALLVFSMAILYVSSGQIALAVVFVTCYGCANGVQTIVRGTVPAELFGRDDFGHLMGRLARPSFIARAAAPITLTLFAVPELGTDWSIPALMGVAVLALGAYLYAVRRLALPTLRSPD